MGRATLTARWKATEHKPLLLLSAGPPSLRRGLVSGWLIQWNLQETSLVVGRCDGLREAVSANGRLGDDEYDNIWCGRQKN